MPRPAFPDRAGPGPSAAQVWVFRRLIDKLMQFWSETADVLLVLQELEDQVDKDSGIVLDAIDTPEHLARARQCAAPD